LERVPTHTPAVTSGAGPKVTVTRVAAYRAKQLSQRTVQMIGDASRADGAHESGLTKLIWMNVVQTGADAMIAVALANTIFFSAATSQQRDNVALYLGITMAPFALVAPVIGPLLDKLQSGRRYALAGTMVGRALLAWIMAVNFHSVALYPAVLGFLVLSKAYGVLKGACVPRVLPSAGRLTLVGANARMSIFALGGSGVFGALAIGIVKVSDSAWVLRVATLVFIAAAVLAWRLPKHVDVSEGEAKASVRSEETATARSKGRRPLGVRVITALRGSATLRGLSGFLTLFLAFLIQHDYTGLEAAVALGALAVAAGGGSFLGTAAGARLKLGRPELIVTVCVCAAAAMCAVTAIIYNIEFAVLTALVAGTANSLGKLSLDAIIQRDVPDSMRASTFARSETLLQLCWVVGGGIGIALPMKGQIGFAVAGGILILAVAMTLLGQRGSDRKRAGRGRFGRRKSAASGVARDPARDQLGTEAAPIIGQRAAAPDRRP
jgi:hypothetical protein